ncbi:MAG: hypothetical protein CMM03_17025 [Rhodopirellula sp.]|jgi:hypothetical protein|nr:hypothetical protein [Rhodopirellula sp.]|tara:strand:+ start:144 stop:1439 length:1296 start_codon:yes stop_codon:yes gene_type:complete
MAYEPSEGLYAGAAFLPTVELMNAKTDPAVFDSLYAKILQNLQGNNVLDAAGNVTKNGMISAIQLPNDAAKKKVYADMAAAISAVLGTRKDVNPGIPARVYLTGNKWHKDVEKFKINAYGMADYNSSDVILFFPPKTYVGISLKKKPMTTAASPTLINNAFSKFIEGPNLTQVRSQLNDHRIKFFAGVIKEACVPGGPLQGIASTKKDIAKLNPNNIQDAKLLWDMKVDRQKGNKIEKIALINLKGENELSRDGLIKKAQAAPSQMSFRNFVNDKLKSTGGRLNPLYSGFLEIMNKPAVSNTLADALLTRVLKLNLLDELNTWKQAEFGFFLTEGVGTVDNNLKPSIGNANMVNIHSVMIAMATLSKQPARMELDKQKTFARDAAKVFFTLYKGKTPVLEIELRYKGSFTAMPQFFAGITPEFKKLIRSGF